VFYPRSILVLYWTVDLETYRCPRFYVKWISFRVHSAQRGVGRY